MLSDLPEYEVYESQELIKQLDRDFYRQQYKKASGAKVGEVINCPICNKRFKKKVYQQKFCSLKCKDNYHNFVNLDRYNRIVS